jgi:hypothetical protein
MGNNGDPGAGRDAFGRFEPGHKHGHRFQKGEISNPRGAPRLPKEVRVLAESARAICDRLESGDGILPLDFLVSVFHDKKQPIRIRLDAAISALPYLHAKVPTLTLAVFEKLRQPDTITPEQLDLLTESELESFEQIVRKLLPAPGEI